MIYMKKITTILFSILLTTTLFAQGEMGGFGMHVGFASPTLRLNSPTAASSTRLEATPMNGVKIGINYDATIVKGFGTTIGLNYTYAMYQSQWTSTGSYSTEQVAYRDSYQGLELFTDWQYKFEIAGETYLMLYTGPTIQVHLSLKEQEYVRSSEGTTKKTRYGYEYRDNQAFEDYKRLNVTWGVGAGFQYKQFFLRGGYDFGLINPYKYDTYAKMGLTDIDRWTRGRFDQWQIKIGMYFWRQ